MRRNMKTSLTPEVTGDINARLHEANADFARRYTGESGRRQPVHTVYGGAHLFKSDTPQRLGALALRALEQFAPDAVAFARAVGLPGAESLTDESERLAQLRVPFEGGEFVEQDNNPLDLARTIYTRVQEKLRREPVEDFRIDFEDGYGNRPDAEEDGHAEAAAREVAAGIKAGTLSPFIGIRIKPFTEELYARSSRTLDIFLSTLLEESGGSLPENFFVTLPKITTPVQVSTLASLFDLFEQARGLEAGTLKMEMMVETTQSIINHRGESALPRWLMMDCVV